MLDVDYVVGAYVGVLAETGCPYVFVRLRATQWVKHRIDLRTAQALLGHRDNIHDDAI